MNKPKILIVEDESVVARDLRHQLLELGYDPVAETRKAEEAIVLCGQLQPDLVLMDIQLAGETDGIAAAQTIRDRFAVPVVFLTAFASDQVVDRAKITEPFGYIIKPFDERELRTVIEMALYKHQAEIRQRESREDYAALLRTAQDGYWLVDLQGRILDVNDAGCRMHGYTREEILGMAIADFEADESPGAIAAQIQKIQRVGSGRFERQQRGKDGSLILVEISANYRPTLGGRFIVFLRDITERKRAADALLASERKMNRIFRTAPVGIATTVDHVITEINDVFCDITGYAWEELVGRSFRFLYATDEEFQRVREVIGREMAEKGRGTTEAAWRKKDGTIIDVALSGSGLNSDDAPAALVYTVMDITARHQMEEALRKSESRLRQAQRIFGLGVWEWNFATDKTTWSGAMFAIYGISPESFTGNGQDYLKCTHPEDRSNHLANIREAFRGTPTETGGNTLAGGASGGPGADPRQFRIIRPDGSICWVEGDAEAVRNQAGEPVGVIGTLVDITERKLLESQFRQSQKMEVVGQLAGGVAHDFNNILTAMMLNLELLRSTPRGPEAGSPLEDLEAMVKRAARLTQQLLMFARRQAMQFTSLEFNGALANLLKMLRRLLGEHVNVKFVTSAPALWVEVDAGMLDQVVMNLCINARDAMPNGGTLTLATSRVEFDAETAKAVAEARPGSFVCLQVSDTGCGMSADVLRHMFEPFFTTKEVGKGTGLGLAAVHGIVHQHQGWITVESTVGQGTTFRLYLPSAAKTGRPGSGSPFFELKNGGNEMILLVEDEEVVRKVGAMMLQRLGYRVLAAADGQEALRLWEEQAGGVDLLFTDMVLPGGLTGLELGEKLRRLKPTLKIALMSGYSVEIMRSQSRALMGVAFLPKPFESRVLAATIRQCLDGG